MARAQSSIDSAGRGLRARTRELSDLQFALLLSLPVLLFLVVIVAYPLVYAVWLSLNRVKFFGGYRATLVWFDNYVDVLSDGDFWWSAWVSVRFTVESVVLAMLVGLALALVMRHNRRWIGLIRTLILLPWSVSLYGTGIMFFYLVRGQTGLGTTVAHVFGVDEPVNLLNQTWVIEALAVGNAWNMAPLVAFFLYASMSTIPRRLYDLAAIDQMSGVETFRNVTLPPIRFTLFVFTCITTVLSLKLFDYIFVMTGGGPGTSSATLTYQLYKISFRDLKLGEGAAMSFLLLFMIVGSTFLLYFVWGKREASRP
ncbi:MAG: sugar ABC transporter permease [Alphaproteobacteria bacterium]